MRLPRQKKRGDSFSGVDLCYCTNVHPGESWGRHFEELKSHVPRIKRDFCADQAFALGLRLSAQAAQELREERLFNEFVSFLQNQNLYVPTLNGFPYGVFHGQPVKEQVYLPDWSSDERLRYAVDLAELLLRLNRVCDAGASFERPLSISTVPGAFAEHAKQVEEKQKIAKQLIRCAKHFEQLENQMGQRVMLALEPEPGCLLETLEDAAGFFEEYLLPVDDELVRQYLGLCLDACHVATMFEDCDGRLDSALFRLRKLGVEIPKLQISSALQVDRLNNDSFSALSEFAKDEVYLHQTVLRDGSKESLRFWLDLPGAIADAGSRQVGDDAKWRIHFHVPIFEARLGPFSSTQSSLMQVLKLQAQLGFAHHLEVETYTWDVLPDSLRLPSLDDSIVRELNWARQRLTTDSP